MLIIGIIVAVVILVIFFLSTYKVVNPNEAHVIVFMGRGRKLYSPSGDGSKTSYFFVPFLMKKFVLPLTNTKMDIPNIHLNDKEVAPFECDVIAWLRINDPILAGERLSLTDPFHSLEQDLIPIVQAVARAVSMKQEILDILRDRTTFSNSVSVEVGGVLKSWGVELVNLEVNDIRDDSSKKSQVISDYESIRKVQINTNARIKTAQMDREAVVVEQDNRKQSEIAKAQSEETFGIRQIEKDKNIGVAAQEQAREVARAEELTNEQKVSALKRLQVGTASVEKEANIERATGIAEAIRIEGEKKSQVIELTGKAEGAAIEAKGTAEAVAKEKMAEAMTKFNESATGIEKIRAWIEVKKAEWEAYGKVAQNAQIKIVNSGKGGSILGFPLNAETGADLGQMLDGLDVSNPLINKVKELLSPKTE